MYLNLSPHIYYNRNVNCFLQLFCEGGIFLGVRVHTSVYFFWDATIHRAPEENMIQLLCFTGKGDPELPVQVITLSVDFFL